MVSRGSRRCAFRRKINSTASDFGGGRGYAEPLSRPVPAGPLVQYDIPIPARSDLCGAEVFTPARHFSAGGFRVLSPAIDWRFGI